jgi:hypothetical protein
LIIALRLYYQINPSRLSTCSITIHALLHIADSIRAMGPVWASWAFPTERKCGKLQRAVKGRHFPYASIDKYVLHSSQLDMVKLQYPSISDELAFRPPAQETGERVGDCMSLIDIL